jgi:hypothetical protein
VAGIKPRQSPISRALRRAIECCKMLFEAEMSDVIPGEEPTPAALALRAEATEYNALLKKIDPKGKKGQAGKKPEVSSSPGASV